MRSRAWDNLASEMRTDRFRQRSAAVAISVACHLLILMAFLWVGNEGLRGQPSRALDGGPTDGDAAIMPIDLKLVRGQDQGQSDRTAAPAPVTIVAKVADAPPANRLSNEAAALAENARPSAAMPADSLADGISDADQDILGQIARCLPSGMRPVLAARLDLRLDAKGNLTSAPRLERVAATGSGEDLAAENSVVQAALQCGPYVVPGGGNFMIVADFSKSKLR